MATLKLIGGSSQNPQTVDLSQYLILTDDEPPDPYDPTFTNRVFSRSLLKEGATLPLVQLVEKEQTWNVLLGPFATSSAMASFIEQVNQVLNSPGAVLSWQDDGLSQATYFDLIVGELQIKYSYRKAQKAYTKAALLTFSQPLGHPAGPRPYAAASGIGPLLMISPYASGGALAIGPSTQAGVAGFGGAPQGASSGVFYPGAPSLGGDAPALLQLSHAGPIAGAGAPFLVVSILPDGSRQPLTRASEIGGGANNHYYNSPDAVASSYTSIPPSNQAFMPASPYHFSGPVPLQWSGQHRLFAIARASGPVLASTTPCTLTLAGDDVLVSASTVASVPPLVGWQPYDLGTFTLRASQSPAKPLTVIGEAPAYTTLDLTALIALPDNRTWFLSPSQPYANLFLTSNLSLLDDIVGEQYTLNGNRVSQAPSPTGIAGASYLPVTRWSRGLVPRPDPKDGLPPIAIMAVPMAGVLGAASNPEPQPQNLPVNAQVSVLERAHYVLP